MTTIQLYTLPGCEPCIKAKDFLKTVKLDYVEQSLGDDMLREDFKKQFPFAKMFAPTFIVDGKYVGSLLHFKKYYNEHIALTSEGKILLLEE